MKGGQKGRRETDLDRENAGGYGVKILSVSEITNLIGP